MPRVSFEQHCRKIAKEFLLTAVVVDDELSVRGEQNVHGGLKSPGQRPIEPPRGSMDLRVLPSRPLDVDPITWSFARQGMVCGLVSPHEDQHHQRDLAKAVARADIVILDWRLSRETGANALPLLGRILVDDQRHRLRLIAFYTGEPDRERILHKITERLRGLDIPYRTVSTNEDYPNAIDFGACRIVVYGKPGPDGRDLDTVVKGDELAHRLIEDFANMVEGLLPSLVLAALTSVRDNVYRVLERFGSTLDPAFLAHRACLPLPLDSEQHIVEQIASELHGIMEDAVVRTSPAGIQAIELWLADRFDDGNVVFGPKKKEVPVHEVIDMLTHGVEEKPGRLRTKGKDYNILCDGFSGGADNSRELDRHLASAMSFRQVLEGGTRQLLMGTVVRQIGSTDAVTLLCVTPRCDSVRLKQPSSSFLFLPLAGPKAKTLQLVVPSAGDGHTRMTICMDPSGWRTVDFAPDPTSECVVAGRTGKDESFVFRDVSGIEYEWVGELKAEFAQSVAQAIAARMSRLALNKSEWLRRSEGLG